MLKSMNASTMLQKICLPTVVAVTFAFAAACGSTPNTSSARNPNGAGPAPVSLTAATTDLTSCGAYVIMAKTGIDATAGASVITGNIAVSPVAFTALTGFSQTPSDASAASSTSTAVVGGGKLFAANYAVPTPNNLTTAIASMQTAYTDAAGRTSPDFTELAAGSIGGLTLAPGLYNWSSTVNVASDVTIAGGANDTWIFQIAGNLTMSSAKKFMLSGGAQAKNITWQVAGQVTLGTTAHLEGIILSQTAITLNTGASMNGRALAQTLVTLQGATVTQP